MFRSVLATILTAGLLTFGVAPVSASIPARPGNSFDDHADLVDTLTDAGVRVYFNPSVCEPEDGPTPSGFYISQSRQLVVCQDAGKYDGEVVPFTANDLDTIRHEAQHVVQDCIDGIGDNSLINMFPVSEDGRGLSLREFVATSGLSPQTLMHIFTTYTAQGANTRVLALEFEAFAVANSIGAADIAQAVEKACAVNINN